MTTMTRKEEGQVKRREPRRAKPGARKPYLQGQEISREPLYHI
jgi:hypothetical protein